jgi:hypothetical protein
VFPISIDYDAFADGARRPTVAARAAEIRRQAGGGTLLLGVDRLDYTKAVAERLRGFREALRRCMALPSELSASRPMSKCTSQVVVAGSRSGSTGPAWAGAARPTRSKSPPQSSRRCKPRANEARTAKNGVLRRSRPVRSRSLARPARFATKAWLAILGSLQDTGHTPSAGVIGSYGPLATGVTNKERAVV